MNYTVVLLAAEEGGYTAVVPALPGCISEGDTLEEAMDMAAEAIFLYLESAEEHNEGIPVEIPGTLVAVLDTESGNYRTRAAEIA